MLSGLLVFLLALTGIAGAQPNADWTTPFPPYRVIGNMYYVGSRDLASFLITTPQGHILINSNLATSPPQIEKSVEQLGFKFSDIKVLLISHAHYDHAAGSARIVQMTHAKYMVMDGDVSVIESGGKTDFNYAKSPDMYFPPAKVNRVLHDGDEVRLGGVVLVAHKTPGHTKGCTTWTMTVADKGARYNVVIVGSPNVNPGYKLVNNKTYPQIAQDYETTFRVLKALHCDVFLGAHASYYDMLTKYAQLKDGDSNPFIDPADYKAYVADREQAFLDKLHKQESGGK